MRFTGNAKSDPNAVYPADDYFLTCTHVQDKDKEGNPLKSKKGNDMWVLELTVAEGPHKDRKQWHYLVWLPAGAPGHGMTLKALKAFGIDPEGDNDILPEHLLNVTVKARVGIQEQDGYEPKNVVDKWYTPSELAKPAAIAAAEAAAGTAQAPEDDATSFDPKKLEGQPPAQPAAPAAAAPGPRKSLWGAGSAKTK
jgi:hypothetical protein